MSRAKDILVQLLPPIITRSLAALSRKVSPPTEAKPSPRDVELTELSKMPRHVPVTVKHVFDKPFEAYDAHKFLSLYRNFFGEARYRFTDEGETPLIIDGGANIGMSVRYWKSICPQARVIAFEPDEDMFSYLKKNCKELTDVEVHRAALWVNDSPIEFAAVGGLGGHVAELHEDATVKKLSVPAHRLRDLLGEEVAMLKLDIEGAEIDVLLDCADRLVYVRRLFVEYHSFIGEPQRLAEFFGLLESSGFRIHAIPEMPAEQPFVERPVSNGKDFRLNVFCTRD